MLGVNERMGLKLFSREIIFEEFKPIRTRCTPKRYRRTDRQTTCNLITALCVASRGKNGRAKWRDKLGIGPDNTLNPILTIFFMWGGPVDEFLKFDFQFDRSPNFGTAGVGVKNRPFPLSRHIAYTTACCYTAQAVSLYNTLADWGLLCGVSLLYSLSAVDCVRCSTTATDIKYFAVLYLVSLIEAF